MTPIEPETVLAAKLMLSSWQYRVEDADVGVELWADIDAFEAAVRAEERALARAFFEAGRVSPMLTNPNAAALLGRIIDEYDHKHHDGPAWGQILSWLKTGDDLYSVYLIGQAALLAIDHQSEHAAISVFGQQWIDSWLAESPAEPAEGEVTE